MKWTAFFVFAGLLHASAHSYSQGTITISVKNESLEKVFRLVEKQSGYRIWIEQQLLQQQPLVNLQLQKASVDDVMDAITQPLQLTWKKVGKMLVITAVTLIAPPVPGPGIKIRGRVVGPTGEPIAGASITLKGGSVSVVADSSGNFVIEVPAPQVTLVVSSIGFDTQLVPASVTQFVNVQLQVAVSKLDEVEIIGYGTTTKRLATGAVSLISKEVIEQQPVTNVISALSGRAPGVFVQTSNGLPGGGIRVQIRGTGSINAGNEPLYIIDGVPFASSVIAAGTSISTDNMSGAINPLNSLNPDDIESISILKDADATAIYGSRGANGVILITTKKGKSGPTKINAQVGAGIQQVSALPKLMNIHQYLEIRREAFANDGEIPSADPASSNYAPDLKIWDSTQQTDWRKYMMGKTGNVMDAQLNVSGGKEQTSFYLAASYHRETTVLPGNNSYQRGGVHAQLQHQSVNKKLNIGFTHSMIFDHSGTVNPNVNIGIDIILPPHYPVKNPDGTGNWYIDNPEAHLKASSETETMNIVSNLSFQYKFLPQLVFRANVGYNQMLIEQEHLFPRASLYPGSANYSDFGHNQNQSWIIEPQLEYDRIIGGSHWNVLLGTTYQNSVNNSLFINANDFPNENLMKNTSSASTVYTYTDRKDYRYISAFGRINWNWRDRYLVNASIRRDGSSRFGTGNQFGNFGALGVGWLFSQTKFVKKKISWLSFGKLRASYGTVGNDQIPDYQYLAGYASVGRFYQDTAGLQPNRVGNPDYHWEQTWKMDLGINLGFLRDRLLINVNYYSNQSSNQLVAYAVPTMTGFSSYQANLPARVDNTGWEFELMSKNINRTNWDWSTSINLTLPKNTLNSFPDLATSSYSRTLVIGEDITRLYAFRLMGVDPATGTPLFMSATGTTTASPGGNDRFFTVARGYPEFFGGVGNHVRWKQWNLDIFFQFARQYRKGGLTYSPGAGAFNNYESVLERWQKPGDLTSMPRATRFGYTFYPNSSGNYAELGYLRLKNVSVNYQFQLFSKSAKPVLIKIYAQGQNLLTWSNTQGSFSDPETGALSVTNLGIPPMRTIVGGIQLTF